MTQEEKWRKNYAEVVEYMDTYHRNPSKHRVEDHLLLNWMKHQRKLMNRGELKPDRVEMFKRLLEKGESLKRVNQWEVAVEEIMKNDALRNYQQEMIERLYEAWRQYRSVMVQMPTGTGKTVLMAEAIRREKGIVKSEKFLSAATLSESVPLGRTATVPKNEELRMKNEEFATAVHSRQRREGVLVVAHRRELLEQIRNTIKAFGIESDGVVVESIQKLSRILGHTNSTDSRDLFSTRIATNGHEFSINPSLVIIDEAHHALAKTYRRLWERWPKAKFLGLTATPCRLNNEGFLDLFQTMVQSHTIQEFIKMGWLSDFEYVTAEPDNPILRQVGSLKKRGVDGDYQTKEMAMVLDCEESIDNLYQAYRKFVNGKKGIVYAIDREHARHITEYYQSQGVNCCWIEAKTPTAERDRLVQKYRDGLIDVVVNVDILGEGADFPEVEFIQLARPTLSLSKYLQQVGRGMRIAEGKDRVVILDHVGMYQSFGLPTEDWNWPLMFTGQMAGRAGMGREGLLYVRGDGTEKELIGTHMVNIKRKDEEHRGLEVYIKDGLYGIAKDGRAIHQPLFEHVRKADDGFFAYCTYPYPVYKGRVTIIDMDGRDLGLKIYGSLEWEDNAVLKGSDINGKPLYWDREFSTYYHEEPEFVSVGGIEMTRLKTGYVLRKYPELMKPTRKEDIYYNGKIVWMRDWLISKGGGSASSNYRIYRILSYGNNYFYVKSAKRGVPSVTLFDKAGNPAGQLWSIPDDDDHKIPVWRHTQLTNAYTGKEGFPKT